MTPLLRTAVLACAALLLAGCPKKGPSAAPAPPPLPAVEQPGAAQPPPAEQRPTAEELSRAPETVIEEVDAYYVRFRSAPTRSVLPRKPEVLQQVRRLLLGPAREQEQAHRALASMPLASAYFLLPAIKDLAREKGLDAFQSEDKAMEVIYEIQGRYLRAGDMEALLTYFAAVTGKDLLVERCLLDEDPVFEIRPVYPLPTLSRVADHLKLEDELWKDIDADADTLELSTRMAYDLTARNEDVAWLLSALARVGGLELEMDPRVKGPVNVRVRARTPAEAMRQVAEQAGYRFKKAGDTVWVHER